MARILFYGLGQGRLYGSHRQCKALGNAMQARNAGKGMSAGGGMKNFVKMVVAGLALFLFAGPASAEGNLASRPTGLELTLNPDLSMTLADGRERVIRA